MYSIGILIGAFCILIELKKHKLTPLIIFSSLWSCILLLSAFRLYHLDEASNQAYIVISIGMFGFGIGYLMFNKIAIRLHKKTISYNIRERLILILSCITIFLYLMDFMKVANYLMNGQTLAYIRALSQDSTSILYSNRGKLETAVRYFIIQPFAMSLQVIVATEFLNGKKKWLIIDIIIIILRVLSEGSRSLILYLGFHMIIAFILDNKVNDYINRYKGKINVRRRKKYIKLIVLAAVLLVIYTTFSRSGERAFRTTYYYFSMEPTMLGLWLQEIKKYGFGLASINGLVYPVLFLIKNTFQISTYPLNWYHNIFLLIDDTDKIWKTISSFDNTQANAYVSIFWFAFLDGGYIGTFVILFAFGMIYSLMYHAVTKHRDKKTSCLYSYLLQGLVFSFIRLQFADVSYALGFMFLLIVAFRKREVSNEKQVKN
ncbi:MAG: oligosaccharide repeat unit polymerase [Lachnospiraceae bacterium]|nr:oligosaccharide repeat unit polymerase [Lachnospiraceae bacterium]